MVAVVAQYEAWQHRRHAVKPGVTGLWQISDQGDKLLRDCTEMELAYLDQVSLRIDVQILMKTIPAMVKRQGI
jgi:lipopolysaccharide/colanic/teichoic acid biosynthesis glycosyltransferase